MNNTNAPQTPGTAAADLNKIPTPYSPIPASDAVTVPTPAKGNDEGSQQPAKTS
jgi:hypothetical protein